MWDEICELFRKKPSCYVMFEHNGKEYKVPCYSIEEARGFSNAIHLFEITDASWIVER